MQTSLATMEERDRMDTLDSVRDSQLSFSADTESESNSSSTCCSSSSSTKTVSLLDRLLRQHIYINCSCMRKFQKEKNYYKNNRGSFWELENRIMGRKKRIMCGCLTAQPRSVTAQADRSPHRLDRSPHKLEYLALGTLSRFLNTTIVFHS